MNESLPKLLLAEDDAVSRVYLGEVLSTLPAAVCACGDGASALAAAREQCFDLLLFDLGLPDGDGRGLLARLRADAKSASRQAPALALSAETSPALRAEVGAHGFCELIGKPVAPQQLKAAVVPLLGSKTVAPLWDDAQATRAIGNLEQVRRLRQLLLRDLPAQRETIVSALQRGEAARARAELHRLLAACGFCGAMALGEQTRWLIGMIDQGRIETPGAAAFDRACGMLLANESLSPLAASAAVTRIRP